MDKPSTPQKTKWPPPPKRRQPLTLCLDSHHVLDPSGTLSLPLVTAHRLFHSYPHVHPLALHSRTTPTASLPVLPRQRSPPLYPICFSQLKGGFECACLPCLLIHPLSPFSPSFSWSRQCNCSSHPRLGASPATLHRHHN